MKNKLKMWTYEHLPEIGFVVEGVLVVVVVVKLLSKHAENEAAKDLGYEVLNVLESGHTLTVTCPFETEITL
jgi:hypothetical protein